jgi:hypothetical protein
MSQYRAAPAIPAATASPCFCSRQYFSLSRRGARGSPCRSPDERQRNPGPPFTLSMIAPGFHFHPGAQTLKRRGRSAERRSQPPTVPLTFILPLVGEDRGGGAARVRRDALASRRSTAALARGFAPAGSTPGHASWDLDPAGVTRLRLSQSRESTSRTGRSTGVNDARSRPDAGRNPERGNHSRSTFESTLAKGPSGNEMTRM